MQHDLLDLMSYSPSSPNRPPDWRSRLIDAMHQAPAEYRYRTLTTVSTDAAMVFLIRQHFETYSRAANSFHEEQRSWGKSRSTFGIGIPEAEAFRSTTSTWQRANMEAWLLTGLSDEQIAEKTSHAPSTICWFERLFFCCRDRLPCESLIASNLTNDWAELPSPEDVLKQLAYRYGPTYLEFTLKNWDGTTRFVHEKRRGKLKNAEAQRRLQSLRLTILTRLLPLRERTSLRDLRELERCRQIAAEMKALSSIDFYRPLWTPDEIRVEQFRRKAVLDENNGNVFSTRRKYRTRVLQNTAEIVKKQSA